MMTLTLGHFLSLGAMLFALSVIGIFLNRKNLIVLLMAIELMLLAVNMNFVAFSHYLGDMHGQVFVFFILTVAAAESAKGKYGYTLRVRSGGQQRSVYGAAAHLAAVFYQALGQKVSCSPVAKPASLDADDVAEVVHRFCDAALRLQPGIAVEADVQVLIAQLAQEAADHAGQPVGSAVAAH